MDPISETISTIRTAAETYGLAALARDADVPYTTVKSFADRDWSHKNLDVVRALGRSALRLSEGGAA